MTPQVISLSAAGSTAWIPVDYKQNPFNIDVAVVLSNTPNLTYRVEYTLDNIFNTAITPTAFSVTNLSGLTANGIGSIVTPVRAIRLTISAWTSGTATLTSLQGSVNAARPITQTRVSRRSVGQNLTATTSLFALVAAASGGTCVTSGASEPQSVTATCTATGNARLGMAKDITYDTSKYYEFSVEVEDFSFTNQSIVTGQLMGVGYVPAEGTQYLTVAGTSLVKGSRIAIRFRPGNTTDYLRLGMNINAALPATSGDFIKLSRPALYEVSSLTGSQIPYTYSRYGVLGSMSVGTAPYAPTDAIGSCVLCCGDSWFDFTTDPPALLGKDYGREVIISATGGYTLANISTALNTLLTNGTASLNPTYNHIPGICVVEGGINDIVADTSGSTVFTRLQTILTTLSSRNIIPIIVLPTLPTDSTYSTAGRRTAIDLYRKLVLETGIDYIDGPLYFCNADGTANTTYMTDDAGAHLHLLPAGCTLLTRLMDEKIRTVESNLAYYNLKSVW